MDLSHFLLLVVNPKEQSRENLFCQYLAFILSCLKVQEGPFPAEGSAVPNYCSFPNTEVSQPCFLCLSDCASTSVILFRQKHLFKLGKLIFLILSAVNQRVKRETKYCPTLIYDFNSKHFSPNSLLIIFFCSKLSLGYEQTNSVIVSIVTKTSKDGMSWRIKRKDKQKKHKL